MLPVLLSLSLVLAAPPADPPAKGDAPKTETAKRSPRRSPAVPETEVKSPTEAQAKAKAAAPNSVPQPALDRRRLAEAEAQVARLACENARLQQELALAQGISTEEIRTPGEALAELRAGNGRFAAGKRVRTLLAAQDPELRKRLAKGQTPFAVIVTCSDSRVVDNLIFDQEPGRLFTVREAGNALDLQGLASVEYACEHLGTPLVLIMGHTSCGAVKAVAEAKGKPLPGNLWAFQAGLAGLMESVPEDPNESHGIYLDHLSEAHARRQARAAVDRSEALQRLIGAGRVKVLPALYDLESGSVRFLEPLPGKADHP